MRMIAGIMFVPRYGTTLIGGNQDSLHFWLLEIGDVKGFEKKIYWVVISWGLDDLVDIVPLILHRNLWIRKAWNLAHLTLQKVSLREGNIDSTSALQLINNSFILLEWTWGSTFKRRVIAFPVIICLNLFISFHSSVKKNIFFSHLLSLGDWFYSHYKR